MELINEILIAVCAPALLILFSISICDDIFGLRDAVKELRRERRR